MDGARFDYVIVGGGTAGCVLANRLTEDGRSRVLLLEAGGSARHPHVLVPGLSTRLMGNPRWDWCYLADPDASRNGRADIWPAGKVLGGGSSINGMVYLRGHAADYDDWARHGATGWSYSECLPYFIKCESNERFKNEWHGQHGPLQISDVRTTHPLNDAFLAACVNAGMRRNEDVNGATAEGVGPMQTNQRGGMRMSTARAYLDPAVNRANLTVHTGALARRILLADGRATSVEYVFKGRTCVAHAGREVVLSAGALASPKLLMLSGIGPPEELRRHGIECLVSSPSVGDNLQEHPGVIVDFELTTPTLNRIAHSKRLYLKAVLDYLLHRRGPAASPIAHVVGFFRSDASVDRPDIQLHFAPFAYEFASNEIRLAKTNRVGVAINVCRPQTRGRLLLRNSDATDAPVIQHQLMGSASDVAKLTRAGRIIQRVFQTMPLKDAFRECVNPGPTVQTDAQWEVFLRERGFLMYHPVGTCRMGDDSASVVDSALRVRGVAGLRVVDASVMPSLPSANTNGPTIMIAEKAADLIRGLAPAAC